MAWPELHCGMAKGPPGLPADTCAFARHPLAGRHQHRSGLSLWPSHCKATTAKCLVEFVVLGALHVTLRPKKMLLLLGIHGTVHAEAQGAACLTDRPAGANRCVMLCREIQLLLGSPWDQLLQASARPIWPAGV